MPLEVTCEVVVICVIKECRLIQKELVTPALRVGSHPGFCAVDFVAMEFK